MNWIIKCTFLYVLIVLIACKKDAKPVPIEYPLILLTEINGVTSEGATFYANISNLGSQGIIDYGFVWNDSIPNPTLGDYVKSLGNTLQQDNFNFRVTSALKKGINYKVRAYVKTNSYLVYSNESTFKSLGSLPPVISNFSPQKGYAGVRVTIMGKNFSNKLHNINLKFGDTETHIDSVKDTIIYCKSPLITSSGNVKISIVVTGQEAVSQDYFNVFYPWLKKADYIGYGIVSAAYFSINNKGYIIGGQEYSNLFSGGPFTKKVYLYDPNNDSWTRKQDAPSISSDRNAFVINNIGYAYFRDANSFYSYNSENDSWKYETNYPGNGIEFITFVINGIVYIGTGHNNTQVFSDFYKYNPTNKLWNKIADFPGNPRYAATAFSLNGKGYVGLGQDFFSYFSDFWMYDPITNSWSQKSDFPGSGRSMLISFVLDSIPYIGLGTREENYFGYSDIWEYQPNIDNWSKKDEYIGNGKWDNIVFTLNNKAYIGLGAKTSKYSSWSIWSSYNDLWEYNPNLSK